MNGSDDAAGNLHSATVVVNVQDMRRAVAFWCAALSYRPRETAWVFTGGACCCARPDAASAPCSGPC
jgi:hypothetical protein